MSYTGGVLLFPLVAGDRSQLGVIEFDCVVSEEHTVENEVTGYPVETGFIIADHAIKKNRKLSLNVIVGNTMSTGNYVNTVENSGLTPAGNVTNSFPSIQEAHNHLTGVCIEARECQVSTIYGIYNHAIVTKYYTKQDVNNVSVIVARLEIEDIYKIDITGVGKTKGATTQYSNTKDTEAQSQVTSTGG